MKTLPKSNKTLPPMLCMHANEACRYPICLCVEHCWCKRHGNCAARVTWRRLPDGRIVVAEKGMLSSRGSKNRPPSFSDRAPSISRTIPLPRKKHAFSDHVRFGGASRRKAGGKWLERRDRYVVGFLASRNCIYGGPSGGFFDLGYLDPMTLPQAKRRLRGLSDRAERAIFELVPVLVEKPKA